MAIAPTKASNLSNKNMTKNTIALNSIKSVKAFLDQIKQSLRENRSKTH